MSRKSKKTSQLNKIKCIRCEKEKAESNYYINENPLFPTDKTIICKDCISDYIGEKDSSGYLDRIIMILSILNKPFLYDLWERRDKDWNKYIPQLSSLHQYRSLTFKDSVFSDNKMKSNIKEIEQDEVNKEVDSKEIDIDLEAAQARWGRGKGLTIDDYIYLENFFNEYKHSYETDTPVQVNLYKNIAKVHLQAEKELANGNIKNFKDLMDLSSKLHNDGNIKPIQSTGANDNKGLSTYGLWIKEIEKTEPCEYFKDKPVYEDYDKFKKYLDNWFVRPMKNVFNISKDFNIKD